MKAIMKKLTALLVAAFVAVSIVPSAGVIAFADTVDGVETEVDGSESGEEVGTGEETGTDESGTDESGEGEQTPEEVVVPVELLDVVVNTSVRPAGHCLENFVLTVNDATSLADLKASDFTMSGRATSWPGYSWMASNFTAQIVDVAIDGNEVTLTVDGFTKKYFYVLSYTVTCSANPALTFTMSDVSKVNTPIHDDFQYITASDMTYRFYEPKDVKGPVPVVVAYHGYGDTDNTLTNQVVTAWADPANQAKRPCYVIAPVISNISSQAARTNNEKATYDLINKLIAEGKVDARRVYITGKSYGGLMVMEFCETYPDMPAAALQMCGYLNANSSSTSAANLAKMKDIPIWIAQATSDNTSNISNSRNAYNGLVSVGSEVVKFTEYSDAEMNAAFEANGTTAAIVGYHGVEVPVLTDQTYHEWLFSNVKPLIKDVVVNTTVRPTGHCLENITFNIVDPAMLANVSADDFSISGKAYSWLSTTTHDWTADVTAVAVEGNKVTLTIDNFYEKFFYVDSFEVTCSKNADIVITNENVKSVVTPVADDFVNVKKTEGTPVEYNIFSPKGVTGPQPVVIAFHGYGDTDNTLQNRVALSWAMPENQAKNPAYVIAPVIANYGATSRNTIYEGTMEVVQQMIEDGKIDPDRIYVVGKSYGGMATYEFTEKYADDVAAAIAMCGAVTASKTIVSDADKLVDIPLWIAQAVNDDTVKSQQNVDLYNQLVAAGSKVVKAKFYTDEEMNAWGVDGKRYGYHTVEIPVCEDAAYHDWLFAQNKADSRINGFAKVNDVWGYYKNSKVDTSYTGLCKNEAGWWYVSEGLVDFTYTGLGKNEAGWWYVKNGKVDLTYTGMAKNEYGWWYVTDGKVDLTYTGMAKNEAGWWYLTNGKVDFTYTGMAKNEFGWWYINNGKFDNTYTGIAQNDYGWWYMENGGFNNKYTGTVEADGTTYQVTNGKVAK